MWTSLYVLHIFRMLGILHAGIHIECPRSNLTATPAWREKTSNKQARVWAITTSAVSSSNIPDTDAVTAYHTVSHPQLCSRSARLVSLCQSHTTWSLVSPRDQEKKQTFTVVTGYCAAFVFTFPRKCVMQCCPGGGNVKNLFVGKVASPQDDDTLLNRASGQTSLEFKGCPRVCLLAGRISVSLPLMSEFSCGARAGASLPSERAAGRQWRQNEGAVKKKPPTENMRVITSAMQMICFAQNRSSWSAGAWCHNQDEEIVIKVVFCSEVNCSANEIKKIYQTTS